MSFSDYSADSELGHLLQQIDRAFLNVNLICRQYISKRRIAQQPLNNNYPSEVNKSSTYTPMTGQHSDMNDQSLLSGPSYLQSQPNIGLGIKSKNANLSSSQVDIHPPPKAPTTPYFLFYKQKKDLIKQQFPDMSVTQLASAAAKVWKSLDQKQKKPYLDKYWLEKQEYDRKLRIHNKLYPNYKESMKTKK